MESDAPLAPPVVAVMVVHQPGAWFGEVLDGLADQDYPNVRTLFLVTALTDPAVGQEITGRLPDAIVRTVAGNPGFGPAANEVLRLVEGDNGFFLLLHDDVALETSTVRLLVEELYRSNAGIVGPKLTMWSDAGLLQHVGLGVDRFGEVDPLVERGEVDQEQHDAVRDVFALPSACLLVRADLFRTLGGFDPAMSFHGDDIDLCWRAHLGGARVVVVPGARARHREELELRRPDVPHRALRARHRMRAVATLTGGRRLPGLSLEMVLLTLVEMVVGLFTGRAREAAASMRALAGLMPRTVQLFARRRQIATIRRVPDREVHGLQVRGSARLASYMRSREHAAMVVDHSGHAERRFTRTALGPVIAWIVVIVAVLVGARSIISDGVTHVGQFLPFPDSPRRLLSDYTSGWWGHGLGATTPAPPGAAVVAALGALGLGNMGFAQTFSIVGLLLVGAYGMWRLVSFLPGTRARLAGFLAYVAIPLPYTAVAAGRWDALALWALLPWVVHLTRRAAGVEPALTARAEDDVADNVVVVPRREQIRFVALGALGVAVVTAFVPVTVAIVAAVGLVLAAGTLAARGSWRAAGGFAGAAAAASLVAIVLNLPWIRTLVGDGGMATLLGAPGASPTRQGIVDVASFRLGGSRISVFALALYLPLIAAAVLARGWRLTWAARAGALVVAFGALAVASDAGRGPIRLPHPALLLAPVACGLALCAALAVAAFEQDVRGGHFGWRQPLGVLACAAVVVALVPGVAATADGRWSLPDSGLVDSLAQLPTDPGTGDYRVLYVGAPDRLPLPGWPLSGGLAYAIADDGPLTIVETWPGRPSGAERSVAEALVAIGQRSTLRGGRLLAPLAIRYVVVPRIDGIASTPSHPLPVPEGLQDALDDQVDLQRLFSAPSFVVYENTAAIPTRSLLPPVAQLASVEAGGAALARSDLGGSIALMVGAPDRGPASGAVPAGTVHVAVPLDDRWRLDVAGESVPARIAFGATMAFEVPAAGEAKLSYDTSPARTAAVVAQVAVWVLVVVLAGRHRWFGRLRARTRRTGVIDTTTALHLGSGSSDVRPAPAEVGS